MASNWSGFHRLTPNERLARVAAHAGLSDDDMAALGAASGLPLDAADRFIENAIGSYPVPLGFAVHFVIDGEPVVVPMAVEESSVIAAASHGAKMAAAGGGFTTEAAAPITIGQIEVRGVAEPESAAAAAEQHVPAWTAAADAVIPSMVERGGGVKDIQIRALPGGRVVVHLHIDCRDAMGANLVNTVCEALADRVATDLGGAAGLRILSNLATQRLVTARCDVPVEVVGGPDAAKSIVAANDFARADPYRAATHNKGIMNGIDPVVMATGNDWRAVEAGAHAYAALDGTYRGLTKYGIQGDRLQCRLTMPMSLGTVGGVTRLHPVAKACLKALGSPDATRLARIVVAVGLAQNLSALKALSGEGIQKGHMALHARNVAAEAGATGREIERVAEQMVAEGAVSARRAREILTSGKART